MGAGKMGVDANELRENKVHDFIFFFFFCTIFYLAEGTSSGALFVMVMLSTHTLVEKFGLGVEQAYPSA